MLNRIQYIDKRKKKRKGSLIHERIKKNKKGIEGMEVKNSKKEFGILFRW